MKIQVQISWKGQSTRLGRASLSFSSGLHDKQIVSLLNYRGLFVFSIDLFHGNYGRTQQSNLLINKVPVSLLEKGKKFYQIFPARPRQLCQENIYVNRLKAAGAEEKRVFVLISQRLEQVKLVNRRMTQTTNSHRRNYVSIWTKTTISDWSDWFLKEWIKRGWQQWHTVLFLIYSSTEREMNTYPQFVKFPFLL